MSTEHGEMNERAVQLELTTHQVELLASLDCPEGTHEKCVKVGEGLLSCTCQPDSGTGIA